MVEHSGNERSWKTVKTFAHTKQCQCEAMLWDCSLGTALSPAFEQQAYSHILHGKTLKSNFKWKSKLHTVAALFQTMEDGRFEFLTGKIIILKCD